MTSRLFSSTRKPFNTALYDPLNLVLCAVGAIMLTGATLSAASLVFGVEFDFSNIFSWPLVFSWDWDVIAVTTVIGLLIWIVTMMRVMLDPQGTNNDPFDDQTLARLKPMSYRTAMFTNNARMYSDYGLATMAQPFDFAGNPDVARRVISSGAVNYATASRREEIYRAAGMPIPQDTDS